MPSIVEKSKRHWSLRSSNYWRFHFAWFCEQFSVISCLIGSTGGQLSCETIAYYSLCHFTDNKSSDFPVWLHRFLQVWRIKLKYFTVYCKISSSFMWALMYNIPIVSNIYFEHIGMMSKFSWPKKLWDRYVYMTRLLNIQICVEIKYEILREILGGICSKCWTMKLFLGYEKGFQQNFFICFPLLQKTALTIDDDNVLKNCYGFEFFNRSLFIFELLQH